MKTCEHTASVWGGLCSGLRRCILISSRGRSVGSPLHHENMVINMFSKVWVKIKWWGWKMGTVVLYKKRCCCHLLVKICCKNMWNYSVWKVTLDFQVYMTIRWVLNTEATERWWELPSWESDSVFTLTYVVDFTPSPTEIFLFLSAMTVLSTYTSMWRTEFNAAPIQFFVPV